VGIDEELTLAALKQLRRELADPKIEEHHGRLFKTTGDGLLVEFASVVDAVRCAVEVQRGMAERNIGVPAESRMELRIGINLGDIIIDDDDIFGEGVNVAARLEALAEPGGICVSRVVRDQVCDKTRHLFRGPGRAAGQEHRSPGSRLSHSDLRECVGAVAVARQAVDRVLPFNNMSGDPEQEYFVDGMVEEIITALSRIRWLFVIARNSSFTYKGKAVDVKQVGRELGVRNVVEGSIRKAGVRVRVTAQLIDAATGNHVWAERYNRTLEDVFAVQEEITLSIVSAMAPEVELAEVARACSANPNDIAARPAHLASRGLVQ
jgi:adenylate cyclase